jgi:hypothetical protein
MIAAPATSARLGDSPSAAVADVPDAPRRCSADAKRQAAERHALSAAGGDQHDPAERNRGADQLRAPGALAEERDAGH